MNTDKTTILPDGSAFNIATILSKEEAMALPLKERPICYRVSSEIYTAVWESVGHASMCWNPRPEGEFDATEASKVAMDLLFKIADELEKYKKEIEVLESEKSVIMMGSIKANEELNRIKALKFVEPININSNPPPMDYDPSRRRL